MTDMPEFSSEKMVLARKPHKCVECSCVIKPREYYQRYSGKWAGQVRSFNTCERCCKIRTWAMDNFPDPRWGEPRFTIGDLYEALGDLGQDRAFDPGVLFSLGREVVKVRARARADGARRW